LSIILLTQKYIEKASVFVVAVAVRQA